MSIDALTIIYPTLDPIVETNQTTIHSTGGVFSEADNISSVSVANLSVDPGQYYPATLTLLGPGDYEWSVYSIPTASIGLNTLEVLAVDTLGATVTETVVLFVDFIPPEVDYSYPADGSEDVSSLYTLRIVFSEIMDVPSVLSGISLVPDHGGEWKVSTDDKSFYYDYDGLFDHGVTYEIVLAGTIQDVLGNTLTPQTLTFDVKAPPSYYGSIFNLALESILPSFVSSLDDVLISLGAFHTFYAETWYLDGDYVFREMPLDSDYLLPQESVLPEKVGYDAFDHLYYEGLGYVSPSIINPYRYYYTYSNFVVPEGSSPLDVPDVTVQEYLDSPWHTAYGVSFFEDVDYVLRDLPTPAIYVPPPPNPEIPEFVYFPWAPVILQLTVEDVDYQQGIVKFLSDNTPKVVWDVPSGVRNRRQFYRVDFAKTPSFFKAMIFDTKFFNSDFTYAADDVTYDLFPEEGVLRKKGKVQFHSSVLLEQGTWYMRVFTGYLKE